jgi:hypothetical protein
MGSEEPPDGRQTLGAFVPDNVNFVLPATGIGGMRGHSGIDSLH